MPRALLAALLLGAASAAPVSAGDDWDRHHEAFVAESASLLSSLFTTRAHSKFLVRRDITLQVRLPGGALPENAGAANDEENRAMLINREHLLRGVRELRAKGFRDEEIGPALAWKFLPTVVHETRHAMINDGMRERGVEFARTVLEEELICFLDSMRAMTELLAKRPGLWDRNLILDVEKTNGLILVAMKRSYASLERLVRDNYEGKPSIREVGRERFLEMSRKSAADMRENEKKGRGLLAETGDAGQREKIERLIARSGTLAEGFEADASIAADPARFAVLRRFLEDELARTKKSLDRIRSARWD